VAEIDKLDRQSAIELAKRLRARYRNVSLDKTRLAQRIGASVAAVGGAYVMGHYMGGLQHEYDMNAAAIDAGTMEDPRKVAGIDIDLLVGLGMTLAGLGMQGLLGGKSRKGAGMAADLVEAAGNGILAGYAFSAGATAGKESASEAA
jgi:hypothetical protein